MKKVYTNPNLAFVGQLKSLLESKDIGCTVKNEYVQNLHGLIPAQEIWPELWVLEEKDYLEAATIIAEAVGSDTEGGASWTCSNCGEEIESQFTECWQCGSSKT